MRDFNTRMAINIPEDETVKMVSMGMCTIVEGDSKEHLLTYGLGPCVGIAIVIRNHDEKVIRLLAHVDMGQIMGVSFDNLRFDFRRIKNIIGTDVESVEISLSSTQSFQNPLFLNESETTLLDILLDEFQEYGIGINDIKLNNSSQVQISPDGVISNYSEQEVERHRNNMLASALSEFGGYIHQELNIYITNFGAWMGNCSLGKECSAEEMEEELQKRYWQEFVQKGYQLVIAQSFSDPQCQAVYVSNWREVINPKWNVVEGCVRARSMSSDFSLGQA